MTRGGGVGNTVRFGPFLFLRILESCYFDRSEVCVKPEKNVNEVKWSEVVFFLTVERDCVPAIYWSLGLKNPHIHRWVSRPSSALGHHTCVHPFSSHRHLLFNIRHKVILTLGTLSKKTIATETNVLKTAPSVLHIRIQKRITVYSNLRSSLPNWQTDKLTHWLTNKQTNKQTNRYHQYDHHHCHKKPNPPTHRFIERNHIWMNKESGKGEENGERDTQDSNPKTVQKPDSSYFGYFRERSWRMGGGEGELDVKGESESEEKLGRKN